MTFPFVHSFCNINVRILKFIIVFICLSPCKRKSYNKRTFISFAYKMRRDFVVALSAPECTSVQEGCVPGSGYGECFVLLSILTKLEDIRGSM